MKQEPTRRLRGLIREAGADALADLAVARGFIRAEQLEEIRAACDTSLLPDELVRRGLLSASQLAELRRVCWQRELASAVTAPAPPEPEEVAQARLDPSRLVERYVLVEPVGLGGVGTVWKSWDEQLRRWVALKAPAAKLPDAVNQRFLREARIAAGLRHPNLVAVYDAGQFQGRPYVVMELVRGTRFDVRCGVRRAVDILATVGAALQEAHRAGIVHRDLKPDNILVDDTGQPRVVDFGLAQNAAGEVALTQTGASVGTPLYMAPEQVRGGGRPAPPQTDVYALGAILYEVLTGRTPHVGRTPHDVYERILRDDPVPPRRVKSSVPEDLEVVCLKALEKEPANRYPDGAAFAQDLRRWLNGEPIEARAVRRTWHVWRRIRRQPVAWAMAAVAALALVVAGVVAIVAGRTVHEERFARELSDAYAELARRSGPAMRRLEESWYARREAPGEDLTQVESVARDVADRHPDLRLPEAWRGIAQFYAGRDVGVLATACAAAGEDPFPHVLLAKTKFAQYGRGTFIPGAKFAFDRLQVQVKDFAETADMKQLRESAIEVLDRARRPTWTKLYHGRELERFADALRKFAAGDFDAAAPAFQALEEEPLLRVDAALLGGLAHLQGGRALQAAQAWERVSSRTWARPWFWAGVARLKVASTAADPGAELSKARDALTMAGRITPDYEDCWGARAASWTWQIALDLKGDRDPQPSIDAALRDAQEFSKYAKDRVSARTLVASIHSVAAQVLTSLRRDGAAHYRASLAEWDEVVRSDPAEAHLLSRAGVLTELANGARELDACAELCARALEDLRVAEERGAAKAHVLVMRAAVRVRLARVLPRDDPRWRPTCEKALAEFEEGARLDKSREGQLTNCILIVQALAEDPALDAEARLKLWQRGVAYARTAAAAQPDAHVIANVASSYQNLATAESKLGRDPRPSMREALAAADRAVAGGGAVGDYLWLRGRIYFHLAVLDTEGATDHLERAESDLADAVKRSPHHWIAWRELGGVYQRLRRPRDAVAAYEKSLELNADQGDLREILAKLRR